MIKSIGKRYLSLLLVIVMLVSLAPMSAQAAAITGHNIVGLGATNANNYWSWNNNDQTFLLSISSTEDGGCNGGITPKEDTLTLTNNSGHKAKLKFTYALSLNGGGARVDGSDKTGGGSFEKILNPGGSIEVYGHSSTGAANTTTITLSRVELIPVYDVTWKNYDGTTLKTDTVEINSLPNYNGSQPTAPAYQGNERAFLGWSRNPNDTGGVTNMAALGRVTADETFYAIFTSIDTFPVEDPDVAPEQIVKDGATIDNPTRVSDDGLKLSKLLDRAGDGSFNLTMESYSTANTSLMSVTEKVPTDFILVVDQSGSMSTNDMPSGYSPVSGSKTLEDIANGSYFIKGDDGQYYRVYAVRDYLFRYYYANYWFTGDLIEHFGTRLSWFMGETDQTASFDNQFYFREVVDDVVYYQPIHTTVEGKIGAYYVRFDYPSKRTNGTAVFNREDTTYSSNGQSPWYKNVLNGNVMRDGALRSAADAAVQALYPDDYAYTFSELNLGLVHPRTGMYINYPMYDRHVGYVELRYRDVNGVEHTVSPVSGADRAEFCNADGQAITTQDGSTRYTYNNLYQATGTTTRLAALKAALTEFAKAVAEEQDTKTGQVSAVDNRVAIVGFSSEPSDRSYSNTELLTGTNLTVSNNNGVQMRSATTANYQAALVSANNGNIGSVNTKITQAIDAITANGGTQPEYGFQMAKSILDNRADTTYTMVTGDQETVSRNTIVVFFTDGQPGDYHYSNQYSEANEVVAAAKLVKDTGAQVFSIGVFGESDGNPLTYNETNLNPPYDDSNYWPYMGGWMETYTSGGRSYCLRRQWRPNNAEGYTATANDTIFDYMSVTSSNYPGAQNFIAPAWLAGNFSGNYIAATEGVRGASAEGNQFYRMASNQTTLIAAFTQAVTHASTISTSTSSVVLNETSVFKDAVNTVDFDVSNATYTVYKQAIHVNENAAPRTSMIEEVGGLVELQGARAVPADGVITYSGFDYQDSYVSYGHPDGFKLVVKVDGLEIRTYGTEVKSNADTDTLYACGIYEYGKNTPAISIESPRVTALKPTSTYIADFNAPLIVATDVDADGITEKNVRNGDFTRTDDGKAVYKLSSGTQQSAAGTTVAINSAYTQADTARITGKHVEDGANAFKQPREVVVIPAASVYYDDDLTAPIAVGDGSGYNAAVQASPEDDNLAKGVHTFTFYGTGIDVYCTTAPDGGMIQARLTQNGQAVPGQPNQSIRNYTEETARYNVPTISFRDLAYGQYTLTLNILGSSNYRLDGIRVYNPMQDQTQYAETDEQYATFINMREALVNNQTTFDTFTHEMTTAVVGALFVDDTNKLNTKQPIYDQVYDDNGKPVGVEPVLDENGNPVYTEEDVYESVFEAYQANSPKHEIYLNLNQALTFRLTEAAQGGKLWIGLSAPDAGKNTGRVMINSRYPISVTSGVDMYYEIDAGWINDGSITITNVSTSLISVTNLKITGVESIYTAANGANTSGGGASPMALADAVPLVFEPVTMKTVRMALNGGFDPEEQDFDPDDPGTPVEPDEPDTPVEPDEPDKPAWTDPMSLISEMFRWLLNSLRDLFSGFGSW